MLIGGTTPPSDEFQVVFDVLDIPTSRLLLDGAVDVGGTLLNHSTQYSIHFHNYRLAGVHFGTPLEP